MSITGVKSYSTANIQGENSSNDSASINARLTIDELAITGLQQTTTGITYNTTGDLTTIGNNITITTNKKIKCATVPTVDADVVNKLYCDNAVANLVASAPATLDTLNELATALGNDPNYATSTATLIGTKASLSANQTISGINTLSNTSNVYYGDGSNLTGIATGTLTTTTMPSTGLFYLSYTTSSIGGSNLTPYSSNDIVFNSANNIFSVPHFNPSGTIFMSNANPTITSTENKSLTLTTASTSTGSLNFQTQGNTRFSISSTGIPLFQDSIYTNGSSLVGQNASGFNIASTGATPTITISPNNVSAISITTTALTSYVPITSTSTVSGATLQSSGNIYLTNTSAFILTNTANANLSVGTPTGGGGLYLNSQGINGIQITGVGISNNLPTTFTGTPPICSTLPPSGSSLANKDYVDYSSTPIGTIVIYSSNTIPNGWLLCDGRFVSTISYASLFAVIGYTYNNGITPATGNFALPDFTGVYTRGKGSRAGLITSTTTLGQLQTSSAGSHSHTMGTISTNTQETTGTVSVVSSVVGSVVSRQTVSNGVITTLSTTGTGNTTIKSYDGFGVENHAEIRPNNISMNYIIKFSGTPNAITVPSFTQASNILVISNNSLTNGVMNLQMRDAGGFMQTPLQLTTTGMTATVPVSCASAPTVGDHLVNKTYADNLLSSSVNVCTTNTDQIISGIKTFSNNLITSSGVYGRNDGFAFDVASTTGTTNGLYPVGHCWEILGALSTPATGSNYAGVVASIALTKGVWAISGYLVLNKGTGAYIATSRVDVLWDTVAGIRIYPASSGMRFPLITTNTTPQLIIPLGTVNVVVSTASAIQTITRSIIMTVGTATWQVSFTGVKIA